jgi:hypothetical protein
MSALYSVMSGDCKVCWHKKLALPKANYSLTYLKLTADGEYYLMRSFMIFTQRDFGGET